MNNELQIFNYQSKEVRTVIIDGEPWFVLKDVCAILGIGNSRMVFDRLDDDEKGVSRIDTPGGPQETSIINESGLYNVILRSDKPEAKPFRKWVTGKVLPSIRKTGSYGSRTVLSPAEQLLEQAKLMVEQEKRLSTIESRQDLLTAKVQQTERKMDNVTAALAAPFASNENWQEAANHTINATVQFFGLNHQKFRREVYDELERTAGVDLKNRQTRARKRMAAQGATKTECSSVSLLSVVSQDKKLRPLFESVLRRRVVELNASKVDIL